MRGESEHGIENRAMADFVNHYIRPEVQHCLELDVGSQRPVCEYCSMLALSRQHQDVFLVPDAPKVIRLQWRRWFHSQRLQYARDPIAVIFVVALECHGDIQHTLR